jgi:hypothetical protein
MNKIPIDLDYLIFAWQDDSPDSAYYLDSDTGSVLLVQRDLDDLDELRQEIELQPNRFLYVPKPPPEQVELDLSDFIFTISDQHLKDILSMALESPNKVAACKSVLAKHTEEMQRWRKFRQDAVRERVRRWLAANDIEM